MFDVDVVRVCRAGDDGEDGGQPGGPPAAASSAQLRIVAAQAIPSGQEVHNTYGEYGNTELIYKHGFALRENPFDAVALPMAALRAACAAVLGADAGDARMCVVRACMREAAAVAGEGDGGADGDEEEDDGEMEKQLEVFGPDCAEVHMAAPQVEQGAAKGFMTFPLFAALWCAGADEGAAEAAQAGEGLVPAALTALTAAAKADGAGVATHIVVRVMAPRAPYVIPRPVSLNAIAAPVEACDWVRLILPRREL